MECHSVEEKLSAYIENQLSSDEKELVDEHLKTCSKCSLSLEDLKKTIAYAQGLKEIEPPPWLTQKVMAKVREEAEQKKGILQKLFYPLHVKIPLEVIATIAIAVSVFYVFRSIEPEIRVAKAPSEEVIVSEEGEKKNALGKDESLVYEEALSETLEPAERQKFERKADVFAGKTETPEKPAALVRKKAIPQETDRALDIKEREEARGLLLKSRKMFEAREQSISLTILVKDIEIARNKIEEFIVELEGKIIKTEFSGDKYIFFAGLDSQKLNELREKLKSVGEIKEKDALYALKGDVVISIEIVKKSE